MGGQPGRHCPALKPVSGAQLGLRPKSPSPLSLQECCDAQQRPGNHSSQRGHLARPCPDTPSGKHAAGSVPGHPHGLDCPSLPGTSSGPSCHLCCPLEGLVLPSRAQPSRSWQPRSHPESTPPNPGLLSVPKSSSCSRTPSLSLLRAAISQRDEGPLKSHQVIFPSRSTWGTWNKQN